GDAVALSPLVDAPDMTEPLSKQDLAALVDQLILEQGRLDRRSARRAHAVHFRHHGPRALRPRCTRCAP
ncbi:hypothetical protein, partial [uncultured Thiodictyon sp.]|uniref:hypothetical protein n=1 Tax=uncultured Thiodictyon sp. TaxID=1846217 RepID=UPI0025E77613